MAELRQLLRYTRPFRWQIALGTFLLLLETASSIVMVHLQRYIIDDVFTECRYELLVWLVIGYGLAVISYNAFHLLGPYVLNGPRWQVNRLLARDLLLHMQAIPVGRFQEQRFANYVYNFTRDVPRIGKLITFDFAKVGIQPLFGLIVVSVIVGTASLSILVLVLVSSLTYVFLGRYFAPRLRNMSRTVEDTHSELLVHIEEGISSTREVVAFHRRAWEKEIYDRYFARYFDNVLAQAGLQNTILFAKEPFRWVVSLGVLGYGAILVMRGEMTIGTYFVVYQFSQQLLGHIEELFGFAMSAAGHMAALDRLSEVLSIEPARDGEHRLGSAIEAVHLEDVRFHYTAEAGTVLDGVTLTIPRGKKVALVGESGSGKSTVAKLLIRFHEPSGGQIMVNDVPLSSVERSSWLRRVAIVFQEPYIFGASVRTNLLLGQDDIPEARVVEACKAAEIHDTIQNLPEGYETVLGERGITLSGGQRQRLALARALVSQPEMLILDEATSALDLETERRVQENLDALRGVTTTVIIAHRLSTVENADLIYVMDRGRVVEYGTHESLLVPGSVYSSLVGKQVN